MDDDGPTSARARNVVGEIPRTAGQRPYKGNELCNFVSPNQARLFTPQARQFARRPNRCVYAGEMAEIRVELDSAAHRMSFREPRRGVCGGYGCA